MLIAAKLQFEVPAHVAAALTDQELTVLMKIVLRRARDGGSLRQTEKRWLHSLNKHHRSKTDAVARYLAEKRVANMPVERDAPSTKDVYAKISRVPGHFEANS